MILERENPAAEGARHPQERPAWPAGGPRIVAIGGGNGLSNMLRGLKVYTQNLTAIVTVADDGGGSGMLRNDLGMPPPGDIRNCMQALANVEPVMETAAWLPLHRGLPDRAGLRQPAAGRPQRYFRLLRPGGVPDAGGTGHHRAGVLPVTDADVKLEATFETAPRWWASPESPNSKKSRTAASGGSGSFRNIRPHCPRRCAPSARRR